MKEKTEDKRKRQKTNQRRKMKADRLDIQMQEEECQEGKTEATIPHFKEGSRL